MYKSIQLACCTPEFYTLFYVKYILILQVKCIFKKGRFTVHTDLDEQDLTVGLLRLQQHQPSNLHTHSSQ